MGTDRLNQFAITIPACLQTPQLFDRFRENLRTFRHDAIGQFVVVCNRLTLMSPETLESFLQLDVEAPIQVVHDKERSVAGAWNFGIQLAQKAGFKTFMITAVDVEMTDGTIDPLIRHEQAHPECDLWSGTPTDLSVQASALTRDACDFSCFMLRDHTIKKHGWFDREYKPAYFEDNDFVTRVVLGGGAPIQILAARHVHQGSLTIKLDPEMAHHVQHWFGLNSDRFHRKWGYKTDDYSQIPTHCFTNPLNSDKPLDWWPEQDQENYDFAGGIHE